MIVFQDRDLQLYNVNSCFRLLADMQETEIEYDLNNEKKAIDTSYRHKIRVHLIVQLDSMCMIRLAIAIARMF